MKGIKTLTVPHCKILWIILEVDKSRSSVNGPKKTNDNS